MVSSRGSLESRASECKKFGVNSPKRLNRGASLLNEIFRQEMRDEHHDNGTLLIKNFLAMLFDEV